MSLINSVEDGSVTVATLQLLEKHSRQYFKLGEIHQKNQNSARIVEFDFSQRMHELNAFLKLKKQLECFMGFSNLLPSGKSGIFEFSERFKQYTYESMIFSL
jgi:hypothetical protein